MKLSEWRAAFAPLVDVKLSSAAKHRIMAALDAEADYAVPVTIPQAQQKSSRWLPAAAVAAGVIALLILARASIFEAVGQQSASPAASTESAGHGSPAKTAVPVTATDGGVSPVSAASTVAHLKALLPAGGSLVPPPGTSAAQPYLVLPLTKPGAQDYVALYTAGPPIQGTADGCNGRPCGVLVAAPGPAGGLRALWQWKPGGYVLDQLTAVSFTGGGEPDLLAAFQIGSAFAEIRVVSFAGGRASVLLDDQGGAPRVLQPETSGTLAGLAFRHNDTGGAGTWVVWRWDASLGTFVRADGAFPAFYRSQAPHAPLKPGGPAWADYYAAVAYLQAGENAAALQMARQGINGVGYMHGSPAFYELEATVYRRRGNCGQAVPLYQKVVTAQQPGGGIGWPALPRSYYGLAACAKAAGNATQAAAYAKKAIEAGAKPAGLGTTANDWYGYVQAEALLRQ